MVRSEHGIQSKLALYFFFRRSCSMLFSFSCCHSANGRLDLCLPDIIVAQILMVRSDSVGNIRPVPQQFGSLKRRRNLTQLIMHSLPGCSQYCVDSLLVEFNSSNSHSPYYNFWLFSLCMADLYLLQSHMAFTCKCQFLSHPAPCKIITVRFDTNIPDIVQMSCQSINLGAKHLNRNSQQAWDLNGRMNFKGVTQRSRSRTLPQIYINLPKLHKGIRMRNPNQ